jgi:hypothetical protein
VVTALGAFIARIGRSHEDAVDWLELRSEKIFVYEKDRPAVEGDALFPVDVGLEIGGTGRKRIGHREANPVRSGSTDKLLKAPAFLIVIQFGECIDGLWTWIFFAYWVFVLKKLRACAGFQVCDLKAGTGPVHTYIPMQPIAGRDTVTSGHHLYLRNYIG